MYRSCYISLILEKEIEFHYVVVVSYNTGWFEDSNFRHVSINDALIEKSMEKSDLIKIEHPDLKFSIIYLGLNFQYM